MSRTLSPMSYGHVLQQHASERDGVPNETKEEWIRRKGWLGEEGYPIGFHPGLGGADPTTLSDIDSVLAGAQASLSDDLMTKLTSSDGYQPYPWWSKGRAPKLAVENWEQRITDPEQRKSMKRFFPPFETLRHRAFG